MEAFDGFWLVLVAEGCFMDHQVTIFGLSCELTRRTGISRIAHLVLSVLDDDSEGLRTMNDSDWLEGLEAVLA